MSKRKKSLDVQFVDFFNKYRDAHIAFIDHGDPVTIVYEDKHTIPLPDVLSWVGLFDKLAELHPRKS